MVVEAQTSDEYEDDGDDQPEWIKSYMERLTQLTMKELLKLMDDKHKWDIHQHQWILIEKEMKCRLLGNPPIPIAMKHDIIKEYWNEIKKNDCDEFIQAIFSKKTMIKRLSDKELMELLALMENLEYKTTRGNMKLLKEERQRRRRDLLCKKIDRNKAFSPDDQERYKILVDAVDDPQKFEMEIKKEERAMRKKNRGKTYSLYG